MKTISLKDVATTKVEAPGVKETYKQVPIGSSDGAPSFAMRVFTVKPGGHTYYHTHAFEHVNYIISGEGALVDEAGHETPLRAGDFALVLPNEKHQYRNKSATQDMVMICAVPKEYE